MRLQEEIKDFVDFMWDEKLSLIEGEIDQDGRIHKEWFEVIV